MQWLSHHSHTHHKGWLIMILTWGSVPGLPYTKLCSCLHKFCAQQITVHVANEELELMRDPKGSAQWSPYLLYSLCISIQSVLWPVNFTDFSVRKNLCLQTIELLDRCINTKLYFCIQLGTLYYISVHTLKKSQSKIQPTDVSDVGSNSIHICTDFFTENTVII